jgi:hypothetical protein
MQISLDKFQKFIQQLSQISFQGKNPTWEVEPYEPTIPGHSEKWDGLPWLNVPKLVHKRNKSDNYSEIG